MIANKILISAIIPFFNNTETEIGRCIDSIMSQNYKNFEVFIVDDGSVMENAKMLDEEFAGYRNINVIHLKHGGVSKARNIGTSLANGDYIIYIDADDMISPTFFFDAFCTIERYGIDKVDIIYGFVQNFSKNEDIFKKYDMNQSYGCTFLKSSDINDLTDYMISKSDAYFGSLNININKGPVGKIIKKSIVQKCKFDEDITIGEDVIWNVRILNLSPKALWMRKVWYFYIHNPTSATHRTNNVLIPEYEKFLVKFWDLMTTDRRKILFLDNTIHIIIFLLMNAKHHELYNKNSVLQTLSSRYPWNLSFKWKYAKYLTYKSLLKYLLIRCRLMGGVVYLWKYAKQIF